MAVSLRSCNTRVDNSRTPCGQRCVSRPRSVRARAAYDDEPVGTKVERWLKTPFDVLSFGPRAGMGALVSLPDKLQTLPSEVEKLQELLQDPRPLDEKQAVVMREVEDTLVDFLERGAIVESDILANVKAMLPKEAADQLDALIPNPPSPQAWDTTTSQQTQQAEEQSVVYSADAVADNQIASELTEIRNAVSAVKTALEDIRSNTDAAKVTMLKLNLKEARGILQRRLQEAAPPTAGGAGQQVSLAAAKREASVLLQEVDAQFNFSS